MDNEILLEGKKETSELWNHLVKFYEHTAKWRFVQDKQSNSWLQSIYEASSDIWRLRKSPSTYKTFDIKDELNDINKDVENRLKKHNDVSKFNLLEIYEYFPDLNYIVNRNHVNNFLAKYLKNPYIHLRG